VSTTTRTLLTHDLARRTRLVHALSSLTAQLTALVFLVAIVLWTALFTSYGPVHDSLHALRHALYLIPCH
jgi:Probable cobalt transporter subunit (CbtB)